MMSPPLAPKLLSIDPANTTVVLVGTSECPRDPTNFSVLPEVEVNLLALKTLLTNPDILGVPEDHILQLLNEANASNLAEKLAGFAKRSADAFLFYYAGHGTIGDDNPNDLLLAVGGTTWDGRDDNALRITTVRRAIKKSPASKKILILDSCHGGLAFDSFLTPVPDVLRSNIQLKGIYGMASAGPNVLAQARGVDGCTAFTGELVRVLRDGIPGPNRTLNLEAIYKWIRNQLIDKEYPEPVRGVWQDADEIAVAYNRGYIAPAHKLASASPIASENQTAESGQLGRWGIFLRLVLLASILVASVILLLFLVTRQTTITSAAKKPNESLSRDPNLVQIGVRVISPSRFRTLTVQVYSLTKRAVLGKWVYDPSEQAVFYFFVERGTEYSFTVSGDRHDGSRSATRIGVATQDFIHNVPLP